LYILIEKDGKVEIEGAGTDRLLTGVVSASIWGAGLGGGEEEGGILEGAKATG